MALLHHHHHWNESRNRPRVFCRCPLVNWLPSSVPEGSHRHMQLYRRVLALPRVRAMMVLVFIARLPAAAGGMVLTLHVAVGLGHGYGAAGTAGAGGADRGPDRRARPWRAIGPVVL